MSDQKEVLTGSRLQKYKSYCLNIRLFGCNVKQHILCKKILTSSSETILFVYDKDCKMGIHLWYWHNTSHAKKRLSAPAR